MASIIETVLRPLPFLPDNASSTVVPPNHLPVPTVHRTFHRRAEYLGASTDPRPEPHVPKPTPELRCVRDGNHRPTGRLLPNVSFQNAVGPVPVRKQAKGNRITVSEPGIRIKASLPRQKGVDQLRQPLGIDDGY